MKFRWMALLGLSVLLSLAQAAKAQPVDPWELKVSAAYAPDAGQYLMVFTNALDTGPTIYGRVLSTESAVPQGKDFAMSTMDGSMSKAVLSYNPHTQSFLVVWGRKLYTEARSEIIGLNVGLDGKIIGSEFTVSFSNKFDERPAIAYCPKGNSYLVTWTRTTMYDFESGDADIYAQMIAGDGRTLVGNNFAVAAADNNQFKPELTCNELTDQFLVVWEDQRSTATQDDIYGQLVDSNGVMNGGNFLISARPEIERRPSIAASPKTGNYLVAWEGIVNGKAGLLSQNLDRNAKLIGPVQPFGTEIAGDQDRPSVAYLLSQNVFLIAWSNAAAADGLSGGIYGQFFEGNGRLRQTAFPLTTAAREQYRPDVVAATNTFLALWTDMRLTANTTQKDHVYEYFGRLIGNDTPLSARWRDPNAQ